MAAIDDLKDGFKMLDNTARAEAVNAKKRVYEKEQFTKLAVRQNRIEKIYDQKRKPKGGRSEWLMGEYQRMLPEMDRLWRMIGGGTPQEATFGFE